MIWKYKPFTQLWIWEVIFKMSLPLLPNIQFEYGRINSGIDEYTSHKWNTVVLIKFLSYSAATAQTRSVTLWGVSGSYGQAPAQQGMSGLVRETSHLWLYSSPSPSLQPILREPATSTLIVLYTFECIMWVTTESLWRYEGKKWILKLHFHIFSPCDWSDALKRRISYMLSIYKQTAIYIYIYISVI